MFAVLAAARVLLHVNAYRTPEGVHSNMCGTVYVCVCTALQESTPREVSPKEDYGQIFQKGNPREKGSNLIH